MCENWGIAGKVSRLSCMGVLKGIDQSRCFCGAIMYNSRDFYFCPPSWLSCTLREREARSGCRMNFRLWLLVCERPPFPLQNGGGGEKKKKSCCWLHGKWKPLPACGLFSKSFVFCTRCMWWTSKPLVVAFILCYYRLYYLNHATTSELWLRGGGTHAKRSITI